MQHKVKDDWVKIKVLPDDLAKFGTPLVAAILSTFLVEKNAALPVQSWMLELRGEMVLTIKTSALPEELAKALGEAS